MAQIEVLYGWLILTEMGSGKFCWVVVVYGFVRGYDWLSEVS